MKLEKLHALLESTEESSAAKTVNLLATKKPFVIVNLRLAKREKSLKNAVKSFSTFKDVVKFLVTEEQNARIPWHWHESYHDNELVGLDPQKSKISDVVVAYQKLTPEQFRKTGTAIQKWFDHGRDDDVYTDWRLMVFDGKNERHFDNLCSFLDRYCQEIKFPKKIPLTADSLIAGKTLAEHVKLYHKCVRNSDEDEEFKIAVPNGNYQPYESGDADYWEFEDVIIHGTVIAESLSWANSLLILVDAEWEKGKKKRVPAKQKYFLMDYSVWWESNEPY